MRTTLVPISHGTCSCKVSPMLPSFHFPPHSATRIKALEEGLPKIRDRFKSKVWLLAQPSHSPPLTYICIHTAYCFVMPVWRRELVCVALTGRMQADKNDITKVKKMISELELTMENVGAGSRVKCISCDRVSNRR
mmetsp:Transcript_8329/g.22194  ORF Transcript_8329/g.22194 Transcript_8329/m.22194 type:complete len:136 (+) Transcript_8329:1703-2110(+)